MIIGNDNNNHYEKCQFFFPFLLSICLTLIIFELNWIKWNEMNEEIDYGNWNQNENLKKKWKKNNNYDDHIKLKSN